jgi:hypothetical protein
METNYTLKKLIRGGTALLFLLAFMLTGTFSALGQDKASTVGRLKIDGPGEVVVEYSDTDSETFRNFIPETIVSADLTSDLQTGQVVRFIPNDLVTCYTFIEWEWDDNVQNAEYFDINGEMIGLELTMPGTVTVTVVTATFRYDYLDPEFAFEDEFCADEPVQIEIDDLADFELPMTATYTYFDGSSTVTGTATLENDDDLLFDEILAVGNYTFTLTHLVDDNGCTIEEAMLIGNITVNPLPLPTLAQDVEFCFDADVTFTVTGDEFTPASSTFNWTITPGDITGTSSNTINFGTLTPTSYIVEVEVTNENGCVGTATAPFTVNPEPTMEITSPMANGDNATYEVCYDGNVVVTIEGLVGTPAWTVTGTMTGPDGFADFPIDINGVSETYTWDASLLPVGIYTFSFASLIDDNGCENSNPGQYDFTIEILPEPQITVEPSVAEVCFNGTFDIVVGVVTGTPTFTLEYQIDGPTGFATVTDVLTADALTTYTIPVAADPTWIPGIYSFTFNSLTDAKCAASASTLAALAFEIEVHPEPDATIAGFEDDEVCYDDQISSDLTKAPYYGLDLIEVGSTIGTVQTVTWNLTVVGTDSPTTFTNDQLQFGDFPEFLSGVFADGETLPGLSPDETNEVLVEVYIYNEWGCVNVDPITYTFTVREIPYVVNNIIKEPQIDQVVKTVFCTIIPKDLIVINSQALPTIHDSSCGDIEYRWKWRELVDGSWTPWSSTGFEAYNQANLTVPSEFENTVQIVREVRGIDDCVCGDTEWDTSNVVTLYVVDPIAADAGDYDPVCVDDPIFLDGNILSTPEYGDDGELTDDDLVYVTGEWSEVTDIVFDPDTDVATTTITTTEAGEYTMTWTLTPMGFVYSECNSTVEDYCCEGDSDEATVIFRSIEIAEANNFGLEDDYCFASAVDVPVTFPAVTVVPTYTYTATLTVENSDGTTTVEGAELDTYEFSAASVYGTYTLTYTAYTDVCDPVVAVAVVEIFEEPVVVIDTSQDDFCEDDATTVNLADYVSFTGSVTGTWTFTGNGVEGATWAATNTGVLVGDNVITAKFVTDDGCEDEDTFTLTVHPQPEVLAIAVDPTDAPAQWTDPFDLWVHHDLDGEVTIMTIIDLPGGYTTTFELTENDATLISPVGDDDYYRTVFTIDPQDVDGDQLNVNNDFFAIVVTNPATDLYCESDEFGPVTVSLEVPPYAVFHPTYDVVWDDSGNNPIPEVDIDTDIFIEFSQDIFDAGGEVLTESALGDLIRLREYNEVEGGTFTEVVKTISRDGNKVTIHPDETPLKYDQIYRLNYIEISYIDDDENIVPFAWRLDGIDEVGDEIAEQVPGAFVTSRTIWFQTVPEPKDDYIAYTLYPPALCESEADGDKDSVTESPSLTCDPISICDGTDGIWIDFKFPIKYRENEFITSDATHKFNFQKSSDGVNWEQATPFRARPVVDSYVTTGPDAEWPGESGPTQIVIELLDAPDGNVIDMEYNTYYRITMRNGEFGQGFECLETGSILMADGTTHPVDPSIDNTENFINIPDNYTLDNWTYWDEYEWIWKTTDEYDIHFAIHEPYQSYDAGNFNMIEVADNEIVGLNANDETVVVTPTYTASVTDDAITVNATTGEGYYFVKWYRSEDGGASWTALPQTEPSVNPVIGVNYMPQSATLDGRVIKQDDCDENIAYKAEFAKYTYQFTTDALCDGITIDPESTTITYGQEHTFTATLDPNFVFDGWVVPEGLTVTITTQTEAETDVYDKWEPEVTVAYLTFTMIDTDKNSFNASSGISSFTGYGIENHSVNFEIEANCHEFEPEVFAAAQGVKVDEDGNIVEVVENNITQITFDSFYLPNIITTDLEAEDVFTGGSPADANYYVMYRFVYGNPNIVTPFDYTNIQITAIDKRDDFCEYDWDNVVWERWNPALNSGEGNWEEYNIGDMSLQFIPDQNYRLRANFIWRDDVKVSATALSEASVIVFDDEGEIWENYLGDELINNPDGDFFSPDDVLNITSYPNEDYWTWYWYEDVEGGMIADVELEARYLDRSEWTYEVGCENVDLLAYVDLKEHLVTVSSEDADKGTVELSTPEIDVNLGNQGGIGFVFEAGNETGSGYFQRKSDVTISFEANVLNEPVFDNDDAPYWEFWKWVDDEGNSISYDNPYTFNTNNLYSDMELIAVYTYTYDANSYTVDVDVDPVGSGTVDGGGTYFADSNTDVFETVTLTPSANPGWTFDEWELISGPTGFVINEDADPLSFTMPEGNVHIEAKFVETEYPLCAEVRTYLRVGESGEFDFEIVNYGGTIQFVGLDNCDDLNAGDDITLIATAIDGFQFVNWIEGDIVDEDGKILRGHQVGADNTLNYTVPAFDGDNDINIYAIFVEIADPQYPIYTLNTTADPAGFGNTYPAEEQLHARGVEIYVDQNVTEPGYKFDSWSDNVNDPEGMPYVEMDMDQLAIANYVKEHYYLVVHTNNPVYGSVSGGTGEGYYVIDDTPLPVSATVNDDPEGCEEYEFVGWYRDALLTVPLLDAGGNQITDTSFGFIPEVPATGHTVNIWAKFVATDVEFEIDLFVSHADAGTPSVVGVEGAVAPWMCGDKVQVSTTETDGYEFQHWLDSDGEIYIEDLTFFHVFDGIVGSVEYTAVYEKIPFDVTTATDPAALGGETGAGTYVIGDALTLTAIEHVGYTFDGWYEDGELLTTELVYEEASLPYGDRDFVAMYTIKTYTVSVGTNPVDGGQVSGGGDYDHFESVTVTAVAHPDFEFVNWTEDGVEVSDDEAYTFTAVEDRDLVANFIAIDCDAVEGLAAYATAKTVYITWDEGSATAWEVRIDGGSWTLVDDNERSYDESDGITPGTDYEYEVRAVCVIAEGEPVVVSDIEEVLFTTLEVGDANNSGGEPNVGDITHVVNYITNDLPAGTVIINTAEELVSVTGGVFIMDAADINNDENIDIFDIVQLVNIVFPPQNVDKSMSSDAADIYLGSDYINLVSDGTLAGIQFELTGNNLNEVELAMNVPGLNVAWSVEGNLLTGIVFSIDNKLIDDGKAMLMTVKNGEGLQWGNVFAANLIADKVDVNTHYDAPTNIFDNFASDLSLDVFPNPSDGQFTSRVDVPVNSNVTFRLFDLNGREIAVKQLETVGSEDVSWNLDLNPGMYFLRMVATPLGRTEQSVTREVRVIIN